MKNIQIHKYQDRDKLFAAVAARSQQQLQLVLENNSEASFIIPGGTTPGPAFAQLAKSSLDWKKITIAQSDERWLPSDHPQSNQGLTARTLLIDNAEKANYVAMKNSHDNAIDGERQCNRDYQRLASPFSLTMLGMGLDGHVASLFPDSKPIRHALDLQNSNPCIAIDGSGCPVAGDYPERMSLTLAAILNSALIILLLTGDEKLEVIDLAKQENNPEKYPVSALLNQTKTPVEIFWAA